MLSKVIKIKMFRLFLVLIETLHLHGKMLNGLNHLLNYQLFLREYNVVMMLEYVQK